MTLSEEILGLRGVFFRLTWLWWYDTPSSSVYVSRIDSQGQLSESTQDGRPVESGPWYVHYSETY